MERCEHKSKNLTLNGEDKVIQVYKYLTDTDVCSSDISLFVFCTVYYVNIFGIGWEFISFLLFAMFSFVTQSKRLLKGLKRKDKRKRLPKEYQIVEMVDSAYIPLREFHIADTMLV